MGWAVSSGWRGVRKWGSEAVAAVAAVGEILLVAVGAVDVLLC